MKQLTRSWLLLQDFVLFARLESTSSNPVGLPIHCQKRLSSLHCNKVNVGLRVSKEDWLLVLPAYLGCNSATASRSASGSLAKITVELLRDAVARAKFKVDLPSSGLGNLTVENSGSGSICS
jgi:hypothetical protein